MTGKGADRGAAPQHLCRDDDGKSCYRQLVIERGTYGHVAPPFTGESLAWRCDGIGQGIKRVLARESLLRF